MTSVSAGHIILTPTHPVGSGWSQQESNPGPPHLESPALLTELPSPAWQAPDFLNLENYMGQKLFSLHPWSAWEVMKAIKKKGWDYEGQEEEILKLTFTSTN